MKEKTPLEKDTMREICEFLQDNYYFFWRSNNIPVFGKNNGGKMTFRALPKFTPRGLPDIIVVRNASFIAIEVKRIGAKLRPAQEDFKIKCNAHGGIYIVAYSCKDVELILSNLGFDKREIV